MVKLTHLISSIGSYLFVVTGAFTIATGVFGNILLLPFGLVMLIYGILWSRFCGITKEPTINYHTYSKLSAFDKIQYVKGRSVKRNSLWLAMTSITGCVLILLLLLILFDADDYSDNAAALIGIGMILIVLLSNIHYSIAVYQSIERKQGKTIL